MHNNEKEKIIKENIGLVYHLQNKYKINDFTHDELTQELLTHLSLKLDGYDKSKSKISTFIYMVVRNKLNNLMVSPKNIQEIPMKKDNVEMLLNEMVGYAPNEEIALQIALEEIYKHSKRDLLLRLYRGEKQVDIARDLGVSSQYISKLWRQLIKKVREEL